MPKSNVERVHNYDNTRTGDFHDGDQVTVTLSNGCRANGTVVIGRYGSGGHGMTSSLGNRETGEIVYSVRIESGTLKGATYYADESQLSHGWTAGAAGETCEAGGAVRRQVTAPSAEESHVAGVDIDTLLSIGAVAAFAGLAYLAITVAGRSSPQLA